MTPRYIPSLLSSALERMREFGRGKPVATQRNTGKRVCVIACEFVCSRVRVKSTCTKQQSHDWKTVTGSPIFGNDESYHNASGLPACSQHHHNVTDLAWPEAGHYTKGNICESPVRWFSVLFAKEWISHTVCVDQILKTMFSLSDEWGNWCLLQMFNLQLLHCFFYLNPLFHQPREVPKLFLLFYRVRTLHGFKIITLEAMEKSAWRNSNRNSRGRKAKSL